MHEGHAFPKMRIGTTIPNVIGFVFLIELMLHLGRNVYSLHLLLDRCGFITLHPRQSDDPRRSTSVEPPANTTCRIDPTHEMAHKNHGDHTVKRWVIGDARATLNEVQQWRHLCDDATCAAS